jgi:hypothetical protein
MVLNIISSFRVAVKSLLNYQSIFWILGHRLVGFTADVLAAKRIADIRFDMQQKERKQWTMSKLQKPMTS